MPMEWTDAIRKHAQMTGGKYRIPKKGTPEYDAVKKLQMGGGAADAVAKEAKHTKFGAKGQVLSEGAPKRAGLGKEAKLRKERKDKGAKRVPVAAAVAAAPPVAQHLKFDEEGKVKKPRKTRSDKGKKRGPRAKKEE
jgi:hypothetical protein